MENNRNSMTSPFGTLRQRGQLEGLTEAHFRGCSFHSLLTSQTPFRLLAWGERHCPPLFFGWKFDIKQFRLHAFKLKRLENLKCPAYLDFFPPVLILNIHAFTYGIPPPPLDKTRFQPIKSPGSFYQPFFEQA